MSPAETTLATASAPGGEAAPDTPDYGDAMSVEVRLRPLVQGELGQAMGGDAQYDDFGPRGGFASPPPCRLDDQGALGVEADGELAGVVSWIWQRWGPNDASRNPMLGVRLLAEHRGRGIGTTAQRQLIDLFFRHTTAHRVEAGTDVENHAEQHVLEKLGMTRDGISPGRPVARRRLARRVPLLGAALRVEARSSRTTPRRTPSRPRHRSGRCCGPARCWPRGSRRR